MQRLESAFKPRSFGNIIGDQNRNGHKPIRPQTETATNGKGHKAKRPQTETATNRNGHKLNGHKSSNINCIETWSRVDFFGQIAFVFFNLFVCHFGALPYVFGLGLLIIWHNIYLTEPFDSS